MAKYDDLRDHLKRQQGPACTLTMAKISGVPTGGLASSAYRHRAWWSNETEGSHVQARGWLDPGYAVAAVDLAVGAVTFGRLEPGPR